ncbi:hypothetical protein EV178_004362 [Coemansia sp. RSA 1646]|nr:hypothetical protein EV178_004362 [Coemansia sp. RSA 1646]
MVHRKKPFSIKQKKAQLQAKRARKRNDQHGSDTEAAIETNTTTYHTTRDVTQPQQTLKDTSANKPNINRLTSQFDKLTRAEIEANKKRSMRPIHYADPKQALTMSFDDAYSVDVDIPIRPTWKYGESREAVEAREAAYFAEWTKKLQAHTDNVSLYEKNLEVWRQLWRVVEISDILLMVVDIRHPVLHFPPSLYRYITETTGKPLVVVLNKTDLVAPDTAKAWMHYFRVQFPSVALTTFCCYRNDKTVMLDDTSAAQMKLRKNRPRKRVYDSSLVGGLFEACRSVCNPQKLDLVDWDELIARYAADSDSDADSDSGNVENSKQELSDSDGDSENKTNEANRPEASEDNNQNNGGHGEVVSGKYVTIGLVGHPNVGKSTVINSIMNRTVVSTSRTPGHTKHFQTIHVTPTLRLCDCPGLVFPCVVSRPLQVLAGLYNIAQVQEPYTSVLYLAERVPLEKVLVLKPTEEEDHPHLSETKVEHKWSAWEICEAFAIDRGFYTSKAARPDVYRAALHMLRWELDGRILLSFKPPGFFDDFSYLGDNQDVGGIAPSDQQSGAEDNGCSSQSDHQMSDDDDSHQPFAQQSMFAILGEEDC